MIYKMRELAERTRCLKGERRLLRSRLLRGEISAREAFASLNRLHSNRSRLSSPSRHRRVCAVTGRARGVYRFFSLCGREVVRRMNLGHLPGLIKSS